MNCSHLEENIELLVVRFAKSSSQPLPLPEDGGTSGVTATTFESAEAALAALRRTSDSSLSARRFDAAILLATSLDENALAIVDAIRMESPHVWVLALAAEAHPPDHELMTRAIENAIHLGVQPFTERHLAAMVQSVRKVRRQRSHLGGHRLTFVLERWSQAFRLTDAECDLLRHAAAGGESRDEIALHRCVSVETVRKQAQAILRKTGARTFDAAVVSLLRETSSLDV